MVGWSLISVCQCIWLKAVLRYLWKPLQIFPLLGQSLRQLLERGLPFYASNLLSSIVFYPLLLKVATGSGLSDIGYLRVGQILQQAFAFLPATLVPILFLRLRSQATFDDQVIILERPLRVIWLLLIGVLLVYCMVDQPLLVWLFGTDFVPALLPTRLLLITSLFECLTQLVIQPILAAGRTLIYGFWHNLAAIVAAVLGWAWIPHAGLGAYLIVRLLFVLVPLIAFAIPVIQKFQEPHRIIPLLLVSFCLVILLLVQIFTNLLQGWTPFAFALIFIATVVSQRHDLLFLKQAIKSI